MNNYIYLKYNSIPKELCDDIIKYYYEEDTNRYEGVTASGLNKNVKDTLDFCIPLNTDKNNKWHKINKLLQMELYDNLKLYIKNIENHYNFGSKKNYKIFNENKYFENCFMIQRYEKQKGKYIYHNDFGIDQNNNYRVITYLWYLNDVEEGGETELWYNIKIKPEKGKLLLFPSHFAVPHCGKTPISSNKYIITGWLYR